MIKTAVFIFLLFALKFNAQLTHAFSPEQIPQKDMELERVLDGDNKSFYLLKTDEKDKKYFIQKVDRKTLVVEQPKEILYKEDNFDVQVNKIMVYEDELTFFCIKKERKSSANNIVAIVFDLSTFTKIREINLLSFETESFYEPSVMTKVSSDKTKILIKATVAVKKPTGVETGFVCYDLLKGNKIWDKKVKEDFKETMGLVRVAGVKSGVLFDLGFISIDEEGNCHYAYLKKNAESKMFVFDLYYSFINGAINTNILIDKNLPPSIFMISEVNKSAMLSRMYTGDKSQNLVTYKVDYINSKLLSKTETSVKDLNPDFDKEFNPKNKKKSYSLRSSMPFKDGFLILGQKNIIVNVEHNNSSIDYSQTFNYDFFIIKVNSNLVAEYYKNLPFSSVASRDIIDEDISFLMDNTLVLVHNESQESTALVETNQKNKELTPVYGTSKNLIVNKINLADGSINRSIIEMPSDNKVRPSLLKYSIFDNTLTLPVFWGNKMERFLTINLK